MAAATDVIVVGAGLTGLKAALDLQTKGYNVKVLEARTRVGGRAHSVQLGWNGKPTTFDLGAHFIGDEDYQSSIWELVKSLGLTPFPQYDGPPTSPAPNLPFWAGQGANLQENTTGGFDAYIGTTIPSNPRDQAYLGTMQAMVDTVPIDAPWSAPAATYLDSVSVADWINSVSLPEVGPPTSYFKGLLAMLCRVGFSCEPRDISMLWLLFYVGSSGGLARFQAIRWPMQGAQGYRLAEGAQSIAEAMAAKLAPGSLITGFAVKGCSTASNSVTVFDPNGNALSATYALFAMSPLLYSQVTFQPPLPAGRLAAAANMANSNMFMTFVRFDNAFWRNDTTTYTSGTVNGIHVYPTNPDPMFRGNISQFGLSGDVLMLDGPSCWMMDNASFEGAPALFAFIVGDEAVKARKMSPAQRAQMIIQRMTKVFGPNVAKNNPQYNEMDWNSEPFSAGCPAGHFGKGSFVAGGPEILLSGNGRLPVGNLFFASTETATMSNGYMDGAVWSGTQIALAIDETLRGISPVLKDDFERAAAMRYCVTTILGAIAAQNPTMEWPVIDPKIVFHGPGGQTLGGDFPGYQGTVDFYTLLGLNFSITQLNVESIVTDVAANRAFCWWSVSGTVNATGAAFRDVKGVMVFDFSPPGVSPILVVEDWLLMDTSLIDALAEGLPPSDPALPVLAVAAAAGDLSWLGGAVAGGGAVWGPGGSAVPEGPYFGASGAATLLAAFSAIPNFKVVLAGSRSDPAALGGVLLYDISGNPKSGAFSQRMTVSLWFGNGPGHVLREVRLQTDGTTLG